MLTLRLIFKLVVSAFTLVQVLILFKCERCVKAVVIRTVVGDVEFAVTVNEGKVAVSVKTAYTVFAYGYKVFVKYIYNRSCCIAEYRFGVGIYLVRTARYITSGKNGIAYVYAQIIHLTPYRAIVRQRIHEIIVHIVANLIRMECLCYQTFR
ncbi:MAG: hypothetical protein BWY95_00941 [Bacteroidetes bacterium ADurb.BinA104]|nr:MAG: hypothetical protein BWY95_00941 [Bacteroidetes bacterium ADurb.BinA104]